MTVTPVNQPPTINTIVDRAAISENAGLQTVNLTGMSTGTGDKNQTLKITADEQQQGVIPDPTVNYTSGNSGSLTYTPVAFASGTATITVTVMDDGGTDNGGIDTVQQTFTVTVTPVNQPPKIDTIGTPAPIFENAGLQTINLTGISIGTGDIGQTLSLSATSNNPSVIPNPTVTYTSPNTTGTLTYTPVPFTFGMATITVTVMDNGGTQNGGSDTIQQTFVVTVTRVNQVPTLNPIPNPTTLLENATLQTVGLSGISAGSGDSSQTVTVAADEQQHGPDPLRERELQRHGKHGFTSPSLPWPASVARRSSPSP